MKDTFRRPDASAAPAVKLEPYLFFVMQCDPPLGAGARHCLADLDEVVFLRQSETRSARTLEDGARRLALSICDKSLSSTHARLSRRLGGWEVEDLNSTNGTILNGVRIERARLSDGDWIELGQSFFLYREALPFDRELEAADLVAAQLSAPTERLATFSPLFARQLDQLARLAPSLLSVLIRGESGTGKEVIARALHERSGRKGAFVAVNCGALPATLVESELFGYRKGSFSGAAEDRLGLVRSADEGTLFLDEVGDLPLPAQAALLRVVQEREVMPLGAARPISVDVRFVAATHRDLDAMVAAGQFRADLLARLEGWTMRVPPLRERREDLGLLVSSLLSRHAQPAPGRERTDGAIFRWDAARALLQYDWPLNVRELEQALLAAAVLSRGAIALENLPEAIRGTERTRGAASAAPVVTEAAEAQRQQLTALFDAHHGNVAAVARALGKAPTQVRRWAKRHGLDPEQFRRGR